MGVKVEVLWRKESVEKMSVKWKREGVMDGDSDDEGNYELM